MKLIFGGNTYDYMEDGTWSYNQEESSLFKAETPKRKDGRLKAKYKDLPRYKLIPIYENYFKNKFNRVINSLNKEVFIFLKENLNK